MVTYTHGKFEQIATAIGKEVGQIAKHKNRLEAAAYWYRLDRRRPTRIAPSKTRQKLDRIAKAARRLLASLGVNDPDEAADGPRDPEILNALVLAGEPNADAVIEARPSPSSRLHGWPTRIVRATKLRLLLLRPFRDDAGPLIIQRKNS